MPDPSDSLPSDSLADGPETQKSSRLLWWLHPKVALPLLLLGLLLLSPFLYRAYRIASLPQIGDPFDVAAFGTVAVTPGENAADHYAKAIALYRTGSLNAGDLDKMSNGDWEQATESLREWLSDNEKSLAEWQLASQRPTAVFVQPNEMRFDRALEYPQKMQSFSRLAQFQAARSLHEGDSAESWKWLRAQFRSSRHLGQHGVLIERLTGSSIHRSAAHGMTQWAADPRVDAEQLRTALEDLDHDWSMTSAPSNVIKAEYLVEMKLLEQLGSHPDSVKDLGTNSSFGPMPFLQGEPEYSRRALQLAHQNLLTQIDKPRHARTRKVGTFKLFEAEPRTSPPISATKLDQALLSPSYARLLWPAIGSVDAAIQGEAARQQALKLSLACQLFHRLRGDWPAKLEDLVPEILSELPTDQFGTSGEMLRIVRDGDGIIVYGVGENGTDDRGRIEATAGHTLPDIGFRLKPPLKNAKPDGQDAAPQEKN